MAKAMSWVVGILVDMFEDEAAMVLVEVNKALIVVTNIRASLAFICTI